LVRQVTTLSTQLEERGAHFKAADDEQKADIKRLEQTNEHLQQRVAVLEQRCNSLKEHSDRNWQVWLALLAALFALIVAFLKK